MEVCKWISEMEEAKLQMGNILTSIYTALNNDPDNPNIQHLQFNTPPLQTRISDLTYKIGLGYFTFD